MSSQIHPISSSQSTALIPVNQPNNAVGLGPRNLEEAVLEQSWQTQNADYKLYRPGTVVLLIGSSSAGKSTILNEMRAAQKLVDLGVDLWCRNTVYNYVKYNYEKCGVSSEDWNHLRTVLVPQENCLHIHDAFNGTLKFVAQATEADQQRARATAEKLGKMVKEFLKEGMPQGATSLETAVLNSMLETAAKGQAVVGDFVGSTVFASHPAAELPFVRSVFVYCPLHTLVDHIDDRNQKALRGEVSLWEIRVGFFPMIQYAKLLRPRGPNDGASDVVEALSRRDIEREFNRNFASCLKVIRRTRPDDVDEFIAKKESEKESLLAAFGFNSTDSLDKRVEFVQKNRLGHRVNTAEQPLKNR